MNCLYCLQELKFQADMLIYWFQIDEKDSKSPEKNINQGENAKFGVDLPPNPSTPVSYRNF